MEDIRKVDFIVKNDKGTKEFSMYFDYGQLNNDEEHIYISNTFLQHLNENIGMPIDLSNLVDKTYSIGEIKESLSLIYYDIIIDSQKNFTFDNLDSSYLNLIYYFVYEGGTKYNEYILRFDDSSLDPDDLNNLIEPLIKLFPHINNSSKEKFYGIIDSYFDLCINIDKKKLRKLAYVFIKDFINKEVLFDSEILYGTNEKISNNMMKELLEIEFGKDNSIPKT